MTDTSDPTPAQRKPDTEAANAATPAASPPKAPATAAGPADDDAVVGAAPTTNDAVAGATPATDDAIPGAIPAADKTIAAGDQQLTPTQTVATTDQHLPASRPGTNPEPAQPAARTPEKRNRTEPWAKLIANPAHAPELLALAAVQTIGPRAAQWARQHRDTYPHATTDGLARLAERQFLRFGSVASLFAAVAGSYSPVALLGANAVTYAELILHVAAAYGLDPTDRQRAVELLVLTQVHPSAEDAEAALAGAEQPAYEEESRLSDAVWRLGRMAAAQAGMWTVIKGVNRFYPGTAMLAAIMISRSGARTMGMRTQRFYSQLSQDSGSRV